MKNFFLLNKNKKVFALLLAILMFLSCLVFYGCEIEDFSDESTLPQQTFYENFVGGFNTVFANDLTGSGEIDESADKVNKIYFTTLQALIYFYGNGNIGLLDNTYAPEIKNLSTFNQNAPFPDSIRMFVTAENGNENSKPLTNTNKHWNWLIDPNDMNILPTQAINPDPNSNENIDDVLVKIDTYLNWKNSLLYQENDYLFTFRNDYSFPMYMQEIFEVVLYEIMLGIEPTEIEVSYENVTNFFYTDHGGSYTIDSGKLYTVKISSSSTFTDITDNVIYQIIYNDNSSALIKNITIVDYKDKIRPKVLESIDKLQKKYRSNSRYIGLTKENADKLISYILNEMIGADLVAYDYNTYRNQPVNYRNYVATIANSIYVQTYDGSGDDWEYVFIGSGGQEISFMFEGFNTTTGVKPEGSFTAKPATFVRYYPGETFFEPYEVEYAFANVPVGEYQSILVVPAESNETAIDNGLKLESGFIFNFMSKNKDLKINTKIRYQYYNEETGYRKLFEFDCDQVNFENREQKIAPDGSIYYENDFEFAINPEKDLPPEITNEESGSYKTITYTVGFFKNKKLLDNIANETEVSLSNPSVSEIQDLYKVIPSKNGFGGITVLNEKKINSSFFEIVLDVVKSPTDPKNTDYNFALILVPIFGIL